MIHLSSQVNEGISKKFKSKVNDGLFRAKLDRVKISVGPYKSSAVEHQKETKWSWL